jgi:hypothetical protein
MFNWLKSLFSKKESVPARYATTTETTRPEYIDSHAIVSEAPYVEGVTTEPVVETAQAPKAKKKRYYKPKQKKTEDAGSKESKPKAKQPKESPAQAPTPAPKKSNRDPRI